MPSAVSWIWMDPAKFSAAFDSGYFVLFDRETVIFLFSETKFRNKNIKNKKGTLLFTCVTSKSKYFNIRTRRQCNQIDRYPLKHNREGNARPSRRSVMPVTIRGRVHVAEWFT